MKYICTLLFLTICFNASSSVRKYSIFTNRMVRLVMDTDTMVKKKSVSVGVSYGSDAVFFGRTGLVKYPFLSADVIYNTKQGIFLYGSAYKVLSSVPLIDETDFGAGYLYKITPKLSGNISYTHFFFNRNALIIQSTTSNDLDWKNTYDWKLFKSSVALDYLFGQTSDFFLTLNLSKYIETDWSVFDDKDYLSFTPSVSMIFGTQNFVQKYSVNHPNRFDYDYLFDQTKDPRRFARDNSMFNALNYSFKIPIAYNRPHYTVEFAYKYSIPVNVEGILHNRRESFYNLTFYYVFY